MKLLLKNTLIFDPKSKHHGEKADILIEEGVVAGIGKGYSSDRTIDLNDCEVSPGFCDLFAHFNEPGNEHKETLQSGVRSASFSGFTDVCLIPNTHPPVQSKSDIGFLKRTLDGVSLHVIGAVSEGINGENLTEILDLNAAGAIAFSDGLKPIWNAELLLKSLQYVQKFKGLIIARAKDIHLAQFSHMHEGVVSTSMGLKGEPALSEEISIKRDLEILRYAGGRIHFTHISSAKSVDLIKEAKKAGLDVTCDVAIHQLLFTDENLLPFDSNYKVDPPFRTEHDRQALIAGVKSGVIDAIVSSHQPQDTENKEMEFDLSGYGISSLPTFFSNLVTLSSSVPFETLIGKVTHGPREILKLPEIVLEEGMPAKLAFYDRKRAWTFNEEFNPSKSRNSPQYGQELKGRCVGVLNGDFLKMNIQ